MQKITAIIPCKNEAHNLDAVLQTVSWCDEIMVVDSYSSDGSIEIARKYTNTILKHDYLNSANQKNWAIPQAKHEWILLVDADERVTSELKEEIITTLAKNTSFDAFSIGRQNYFLGKKIRFSGWQNDRVIRLFNRDKCRYEEKWVHSEIVASAPIGKLHCKLLHFTYKNESHYKEKMERYARWGALEAAKKIKHPNAFHLILKPAFSFFKHFIIDLGFLDGYPGFIISIYAAKSVRMRFLNLKKIRRQEHASKAI